MPVQNFYLREVVADADGNWTTKVVKTVFENHVDPYVRLPDGKIAKRHEKHAETGRARLRSPL
jgi:hypothetical protein